MTDTHLTCTRSAALTHTLTWDLPVICKHIVFLPLVSCSSIKSSSQHDPQCYQTASYCHTSGLEFKPKNRAQKDPTQTSFKLVLDDLHRSKCDSSQVKCPWMCVRTTTTSSTSGSLTTALIAVAPPSKAVLRIQRLRFRGFQFSWLQFTCRLHWSLVHPAWGVAPIVS